MAVKKDKNKYKGKVQDQLQELIASAEKGERIEAMDIDVARKLSRELQFGFGDDVDEDQHLSRVRAVENMLLQAYTKRDIRFYSRQNWKCTTELADAYIDAARDSIKQDFREDFERNTDWHIELRMKLLRENMSQHGNLKDTITIVQDLARIQGTYDVKPSIELTNTNLDEFEEVVGENKDTIESLKGEDGKELLASLKEEYKASDKRREEGDEALEIQGNEV